MNTTYSPSTNRISREFFEDALRERGVGSMYAPSISAWVRDLAQVDRLLEAVRGR